MARETGNGKTPQRVVDELNKMLKKSSLNAISKKTGIGISALHRYQRGIGEPTTATLEKLSDCFGKSVAWLRGESPLDLVEKISANEMLVFVIKCGFPGGEKTVTDELIGKGFDEKTANEFLSAIKEKFSPELFAKSWKINCEDEIIKPMIEQIYSCIVIGKEVDKEWYEEAVNEIGKQIKNDIIKPLLNQIFDLSTQDIVSIAAILKQFSNNIQFKADIKQLLNNSVAHSK